MLDGDVVDTTQIMRGFRAHMAEIGQQMGLKSSHGGVLARQVDPSLRELDRLRGLMRPFTTMPYGPTTRRLAKLSIMFLDTPHYASGVNVGWTAVDFWGVPAVDVRDAKPRGLLPTMAGSRFKGLIRGIDHEGCKIAVLRDDGMVSSMQMWRPHPCPMTVPFWESKGLEVVA